MCFSLLALQTFHFQCPGLPLLAEVDSTGSGVPSRAPLDEVLPSSFPLCSWGDQFSQLEQGKT